ncbi:nitrogen assimilation transcription factor nirA [Colletotrichum tofieldiae]|nr:nitrogen assimilation transcription factor nirA [Colletotrichum tofieldiae]
MAERLPLAPSQKIISRRKSRVCTREACELCREKKAKTKRDLQAELEELKGAQRQRDAVLGALTVPGQTHDVLLRLRSGETFESIYEKLGTHDAASPTNSQVSDESSQLRHIKKEPFWTPTQTPLCSPSILEYSNSTELHGSEASHIQGAIQNQNSRSDCTKEEADGLMPSLEASMFSHMALPNNINEFDATDYTLPMPFGMFVEHNTPLDLPDAYCSGQTYPTDDVSDINWWQPTMLSSFAVPTSTNQGAWPYHQFAAPHSPNQAQASHFQPSPNLSPVADDSILASRPSSREIPHRSMGSSMASAVQSQYPSPPLLKKRKFETNDQGSSATAGVKSNSKSSNDASTDNKAPIKSPGRKPPSHDRERHRRASARNWQKQKQQTADLEAAMNIAEARNRELHRKYSEVLRQVMDAKNALMDHAKCNHPAINSWLRCQATKYVLNKGSGVDKERRGTRLRREAWRRRCTRWDGKVPPADDAAATQVFSVSHDEGCI